MALFKHSYSGLITGGLGMPACCGLITMGFGVFRCKIEIVDPPNPPVGGGGGGHVPVGGHFGQRGHHVPLTRPLTHTSKLIVVSVKYKDHTWRKTYTVDKVRAKIAIRLVNVINKIKDKITVGVESLHRVTQRVTAIFNKHQ